MQKFRSFILLVLLSAVILTPLKVPSCPKQNSSVPLALSVLSTQTTAQQTVSGCASLSCWLGAIEHQESPGLFDIFIGILFFLLVFSKYSTPLSSIYRPPIRP